MTPFEENLKLTHSFFGSHYRNMENKLDAAPSLLLKTQKLNLDKLHFNSHLRTDASPTTKKFNNADADKENVKQPIALPKVREFQAQEKDLSIRLIQTEEERIEDPQSFFFQKENSFRSDNISAENMSNSKYRLDG